MTILLVAFSYYVSYELSRPSKTIEFGSKVGESIHQDTVKIVHYIESDTDGFIVIDAKNQDFYVGIHDQDSVLSFAEDHIGEYICLKYNKRDFESGDSLYLFIEAATGQCK